MSGFYFNLTYITNCFFKESRDHGKNKSAPKLCIVCVCSLQKLGKGRGKYFREVFMTLGICNELWVEHLLEQLTLSHCSERFFLVPALCKGEVGMVSNGFELLNEEDSGDLAYWWLCVVR